MADAQPPASANPKPPARLQTQRLQVLSHPDQYKAVLATRALAQTPHFAAHRLPLGQVAGLGADTAQAWGWVLPKRWAKQAVTRNAVRRQMRECAQDAALQLPGAAYVLRLRAAFDRTQFRSASSAALKEATRAELRLLMQRLVAR